MKTVGIIPARWASTRFPGKSLAPLCGRPLIQWVCERSRLAKSLDGVFVATDDDRIKNAVEDAGGEVVMTRSDHETGTDRVAEAAGILGCEADTVVNIQGDEPLIDPRLIDELAAVMMSESRWDMVTAASPLASEAEAGSSAVCKVVFAGDGGALYFSRSKIPFVREKCSRPAGPIYWRHVGIYVYRACFLARLAGESQSDAEKAESLEQLRALHIGGRIKIVRTSSAGGGVDTPDDLRVVEMEMKRLGLDKGG